MGLNIITSDKKSILAVRSKRLDSKYFIVSKFFNALEKKSSCDVKTLKVLGADISSGSYVSQYVDKNEGVPYVRVGNIKPYSMDEQEQSLVYVSTKLPEKIKLLPGDVVLGRTQATSSKLGVASIVDQSSNGCVISQHVSRIRLNHDLISPEYLVAYLNSNFYKAQTALCSHGDTRVEMTHDQLREVRVFIPEEKVLSDITNKVKKIVFNNRKSIDLIKRCLGLVLNELKLGIEKDDKYFSVDLSTIKNLGIWNGVSHLPKYSFTESFIKEHFDCIPLGDLCTISKGVEVGSANYKTDLFKDDSDFAFIRTSDVTNNEIDLFPDYFVSENNKKVEGNESEPGELLFSKDGVIGETAMISNYDRVICASGFAKIRVNSNAKKLGVTKEFLFTILNLNETGFYPAIRRTVVASTIPHLRPDRLKEIPVPLMDKKIIKEVTKIVKNALELKDERKRLIKDVRGQIDKIYNYNGVKIS